MVGPLQLAVGVTYMVLTSILTPPYLRIIYMLVAKFGFWESLTTAYSTLPGLDTMQLQAFFSTHFDLFKPYSYLLQQTGSYLMMASFVLSFVTYTIISIYLLKMRKSTNSTHKQRKKTMF
ncbi:hypothetical protein L596_026724 [Steinernema carpocapsae]|uniref:Uncharacterized protein n=1 Tax=Steinernema carpocapsae TaxID=34508 RepID=A0A4U5M268_STECR|nr:hypothetical protein L596_026724 [Steinernema carpocapsae]